MNIFLIRSFFLELLILSYATLLLFFPDKSFDRSIALFVIIFATASLFCFQINKIRLKVSIYLIFFFGITLLLSTLANTDLIHILNLAAGYVAANEINTNKKIKLISPILIMTTLLYLVLVSNTDNQRNLITGVSVSILAISLLHNLINNKHVIPPIILAIIGFIIALNLFGRAGILAHTLFLLYLVLKFNVNYSLKSVLFFGALFIFYQAYILYPELFYYIENKGAYVDDRLSLVNIYFENVQFMNIIFSDYNKELRDLIPEYNGNYHNFVIFLINAFGIIGVIVFIIFAYSSIKLVYLDILFSLPLIGIWVKYFFDSTSHFFSFTVIFLVYLASKNSVRIKQV